MRILVLFSVMLAAAVAGCAESPALTPASVAPTAEPAPDATATATSIALYLQADLTLAPAPPAREGSVAPEVLVNGPWVDDDEYPTWTTQLPEALSNGTANVTFFVTSSSASFAATLMPIPFDLPEFGVSIGDGTNQSYARAAGPQVLVAGEVAQIRAEVPLGGLALAPGTTLWLRLQPYYSQVKTAEEIRFLVGPDHPARVEIAQSLMR